MRPVRSTPSLAAVAASAEGIPGTDTLSRLRADTDIAFAYPPACSEFHSIGVEWECQERWYMS